MSMGGNATKYDLKSSPRSPGMKNAGVHRSGHCLVCQVTPSSAQFVEKYKIVLWKEAGTIIFFG